MQEYHQRIQIVRKLLQNHNAALHQLKSLDPVPVLEEVLKPQSDFWSQDDISSELAVSWKLKEEIIQAFLLIKRCKKEMAMLKSEMFETIQFGITDYLLFQAILMIYKHERTHMAEV